MHCGTSAATVPSHLQSLPYVVQRDLQVFFKNPHKGEPKAWTWCRKSENFCVASQNYCDPSTSCGGILESPSACELAAAELQLVSNLTIVHDERAPRACLITSDNRTIFNTASHSRPSWRSTFSFVKSLCHVKQVSSGSESFQHLALPVMPYDCTAVQVLCCQGQRT